MIKVYHALSGLDDSLDTYLRCALSYGYNFVPFHRFKELLKQALTLKVAD
jgi:hypothetical protein